MEQKLNGSLKFVLILAALILGVTLIKLNAQTKETKEKLKEIKDVQKITITTENGEVVFDGDDAQKLLKKMKSGSILSKFQVLTSEDFDGEDFVFLDEKSGEFEFDIIVSDEDEFEWFGDDSKEKIEVRRVEGKLVIVHKKTVDGKDETKTYEDEEAEKYLEELKKEKNIDFILDDDDKTIIISDDSKVWVSDDDEEEIKVRVESKVDQKKKKIIIKKMEKKKEKK